METSKENLLIMMLGLNPLMLKSAIWHNMPLHAQYLVSLCEICTAKRSWKDLHTEGIKLNPHPI